MSVKPVVLVHGGAGEVGEARIQACLEGVKRAAMEGHKVLMATDNVLDAVEAAVKTMEESENFNAGRGSVLNLQGEVEMEALLMEGKDMRSGSVTLLKNVANPISVARLVMEKSPHSFLGGEGLEAFVREMNIPRVPDDYLIVPRAQQVLEKYKLSLENKAQAPNNEGETVGAVAVDSSGHVASATSTGGYRGKWKGRIGDTPQPGSGGYSDDNIGAVSTTGHGESILRYNLAHRILSAIGRETPVQEATQSSCDAMTKRMKGQTAGAITVTNTGQVGIGFSSKHMSWAYRIDNELHYGIHHDEHIIEKV